MEDAGLFLIARPGPYICAETDGGGFPGWLLADRTVALRCRTGMASLASPVFLRAVQQWFGEVLPRITACENLIAVQIENEYMTETMEDQVGYMEQMYSMVRGFGVGVPIFHNGAYRPGDWQAAVDICGHDVYPFSFGEANWRPDAADAHNGVGAALARNGNYREAIEYFRDALEIDPDHAEAMANLAQAGRRLRSDVDDEP